MTEAQAAWLRKLRDEGPQNGWKCITEKALPCFSAGWTKNAEGKPHLDQITPAGLAALAEHEDSTK